MTNSLYTEALADAKAVREAAEARAKQQLIEAMSPDIKLMVEKAILGEDSSSLPQDNAEEDSEPGKEGEEDSQSSKDSKDDASDEAPENAEDSSESGKDTKPPAPVESQDPFAKKGYVSEVPVEIAEDMLDDGEVVEVDEVDEEGNKIKAENRRLINKLVTKKKRKEAIVEKLDNLSEALKRLRPAVLLSENNQINDISSQKLNKVMHSLIKEFKILSTSRILKSDKQLFETYLKIAQEFMSMYKRRRNKLNESIDDIFEADFLLEEEGDDLDSLGEPEGESEGMPKGELEDAVTRAVEDLAAALDMEVRPAGESEESSDEPEEEPEAEDADDSEEEPEAEDADDSEEDEDMESEGYEAHKIPEGDVFLEIDEDMLRDEISKMKAIREGDAADMAAHFGGGKKEKELFVDGAELNKLDSLKESARKVVRHNRQLTAELNEHKKALSAMKEQLQEMNLFNAKLLYANKLMQNKDLSLKQQKHIVESLDNAKTLGEAKVLFEGLTKSLNKSSSRTGALTEGTSRRVLGTSSRSTRSAQPANNRVEVDRWALLAGIKG